MRCGTSAGYQEHRKRGEEPCEPCKRAHAEYMASWRRDRGVPERVPGPRVLVESKREPWRDEAACKGEPTSLWFPSRGEKQSPVALRICAGCPVRVECGEAGRGERYGIWGGRSLQRRRAS